MRIIEYNIDMLLKEKDLIRIRQDKIFDIDIKKYEFINNTFINRLEDVKGYICFYDDEEKGLSIEYDLNGKMICPCAITLEDVEVEFEVGDCDIISFDMLKEGIYIPSEIELDDLVAHLLLPEVPSRVVKNEEIEYSIGDDWSIESEKSYEENKVDPRLAILKDFKFDKEED